MTSIPDERGLSRRVTAGFFLSAPHAHVLTIEIEIRGRNPPWQLARGTPANMKACGDSLTNATTTTTTENSAPTTRTTLRNNYKLNIYSSYNTNRCFSYRSQARKLALNYFSATPTRQQAAPVDSSTARPSSGYVQSTYLHATITLQ